MERKFEQGRYIVTDARSGMALDLSGADNRSLIAFGLHGWENQQASLITPHWVQEIAKWSSLLLPTVAAIARRRTVLYATCCHDLRLQWDFRPCGKGYIINSVHSSGSFLMLQDLKGLHLEGSAQVVTGTFPTCWEVEVTMDDRNAPGPVDEPGDIFARYVSRRDLAGFKVLIRLGISCLASGYLTSTGFYCASRALLRERL
jgi:hypothetical protein